MFTNNCCETSKNSISKLFYNCCDENLATTAGGDFNDYFSIFAPCGHWDGCSRSCTQQNSPENFQLQSTDSCGSSRLPTQELPMGNLINWPLSGSCRVSIEFHQF